VSKKFHKTKNKYLSIIVDLLNLSFSIFDLSYKNSTPKVFGSEIYQGVQTPSEVSKLDELPINIYTEDLRINKVTSCPEKLTNLNNSVFN
jgi:hypothetical protein